MNIRTITIMLLAAIIITGCGTKEQADSRTIRQIQEEEGIPVMVRTIEPEQFAIYYSYNVNLSGIKETTVNSAVGDRIEKLYVKVGDYVEKDGMLLSFPEDNPMGQYRQAKAVYDNTSATYERMKALFETGGISRSDLDQIETGLTVSTANYEAASKAIKVKAPFTGYVTKVYARETESVGQGDPLVTITVMDKYKTKVWATENESKDIRVGSKATAAISGHTLTGRVVQVSQSMDASRQAFIVDLEFDNPDKLRISGIPANINITSYQNEKAIVVPRQYIHSLGQQHSYVYVLQGSKAVRREVVLGRNDGLRFEVPSPLSPGDKLITQGTNSVTDGSLVRVVEE